jgi:hypothetical protein
MIPTLIANQAFKMAQAFWDQRAQLFPGWHGYGWQGPISNPTITFLTDLATKGALAAAIGPLQAMLPIKLVVSARFRTLRTHTELSGLPGVQPGSGIVAKNGECGVGPFGTLGAFLRRNDLPASSPLWLLSNLHILAGKAHCANPVTVESENGKTISKTVLAATKPHDGGKVDAAVALMDQGEPGIPNYAALSINSPDPIAVDTGARVAKLGAATGQRPGVVLFHLNQVDVLLEDLLVEATLMDQIAVAPEPGNGPFVDDGDSGSLVASGGRPAGLLFAMKPHAPDEDIQGNIGLVNPFDAVLSELTASLGGQWELALAQ